MSSTDTTDNDLATVSDGSTTQTDCDTSTESDDEQHPPESTRAFDEGEKVIASHGGSFYRAKVIGIRNGKKQWEYLIHYEGWKKSWDEWLGEERLKKYTDENAQLMQTNKKQDIQKDIKPGYASQMKPKSSSVVRGKKRKRSTLHREKDLTHLEKFVNLQIPPTLKKQLVEDCEFVNHLGKLVKLPRTPNVEEILKKYCQYRKKKDAVVSASVQEITSGLHCYFDKALPVMLLYKSERSQHAAVVGENISPSSIYGAEHLLRLFVKLPELLAHANIEKETLAELQQQFSDFLKFLQNNQSSFFLSTYHVPEDTETSTTNKDENH